MARSMCWMLFICFAHAATGDAQESVSKDDIMSWAVTNSKSAAEVAAECEPTSLLAQTASILQEGLESVERQRIVEFTASVAMHLPSAFQAEAHEIIAAEILKSFSGTTFYRLTRLLRPSLLSNATREAIVKRVVPPETDFSTMTVGQIAALGRFGSRQEAELLAPLYPDAVEDIVENKATARSWAVVFALAQLAWRGARENAVALVDAHPNDEQKFAGLLYSLGRIPDWRIVEYVATYLGDDTLVGSPTSGDAVALTRSYHASLVLGRMLIGFPISASPEEQRAWLDSVQANPPWRI